MRKLFLILVVCAAAIAASAQKPATVTVKSAGLGRVAVMKGTVKATVDLSKDIVGCRYATAAVKKQFKDCAASPVDFTLIDATEKDGFTYVVIYTDAQGNCNVCGRCGATEAYGLIWLKFDAAFKFVEKKSTPLEFCLEEYTMLSDVIKYDKDEQPTGLDFKFDKDGVMVVEFEKRNTVENENEPRFDFSHLEYSRKNPEKGFVIRTEKRKESSSPDQ